MPNALKPSIGFRIDESVPSRLSLRDMNKSARAPSQPQWIEILRELMNSQGLNPRSLSLKAGLGATAVRDMLEGRARFPRYDTAVAR